MKHFTKYTVIPSALLCIILLTLFPVVTYADDRISYYDDSADHGVSQTNGFYLEDIKLFPNPCSNYLNLGLESGFRVDRVAVSDMLGNLVWEQRRFENEIQYRMQIPVFELKNGIYFVEIESGNQRITRKISKE